MSLPPKQSQEKLPKGTMTIKVYDNALPHASMSGNIEPRDIQFSVMALRKAFHEHLSNIGAANKARVAEANRLDTEAARQDKLEEQERKLEEQQRKFEEAKKKITGAK